MKKISVLGSTGSIGTQTLEVIRRHRDEFEISALSAGHNTELLRKQLREFSPKLVSVSEKDDAERLSAEFPFARFLYGSKGLVEIAGHADADITVNGLSGSSGMEPTYEAVKAGRRVAFANKETLVAAGSLIMSAAKKHGAELIPVDSEHSAIFQSMRGNPGCRIKKIILTASGGPFRGYTEERLKHVTKEEALNHPRWKMGPKVTVDSASMMNKGLEVIEAHWLFGVPASDIEVVVHPESALHSAVEYEDGCIIGQMGKADMKMPIAYALSYPKRLKNTGESLDLCELGTMHFEKPNPKVFKCLALTYKAIALGGGAEAVLSSANEACVRAFLNDKIKFHEIPELTEKALDRHVPHEPDGMAELLDLQRETEEYIDTCLRLR